MLLASSPAPAQSLWQDGVSKPMFADKRATHVGDIITIVVQESSTASKNNQTTTSKQAAIDAAIATFLYSPAASGLLTKGGQLPALSVNSKSTFAGGGTIANTENITAQAAVTVMDVLPNGNLVIEGKRETAFGGERTTEVLHGVIRNEDVLANNTVFSYNVANATIQFITKGTITDSQRKGWFHRLWDKLAPF
jgi:flagellar L-ring protein FlgH